MTATLLICGATCALMITMIIFFPRMTWGKLEIDTYWPIALCGALVLLWSGLADYGTFLSALTASDAINPLKIALLFLSMTVLSVYLDEVGFFGFVAALALSRAGHSQTRLFWILYTAVSLLTVFTSNDIVVLTFTPFICYFAHAAKIDPLPYLVAEFVAANTLSMALVIGNPTNVYLATTYGIDFLSYLRVMLLPTFAAGLAAGLVLWLLFRCRLRQPLQPVKIEMRFRDRWLLAVGLIHLGGCTLLLAIASYTGWDMCAIALCAVLSLVVTTALISCVRRRSPQILLSCVKRAPWPLLPFILSMFVFIVALGNCGATTTFTTLLARTGETICTYGFSSALVANLINNIPMSAFYCSVIGSLPTAERAAAIYAAVVGSNLGALLSPVGALAGIMWTGMLKKQGKRFGYTDFLKHCTPAGIAAMIAALGVLTVIL